MEGTSWLTFAMSLSVLSVRWSGCSSFTAKSFGERMAGTKNLRKRKPVMARYGTSYNHHNVIIYGRAIRSMRILILENWQIWFSRLHLILCPIKWTLGSYIWSDVSDCYGYRTLNGRCVNATLLSTCTHHRVRVIESLGCSEPELSESHAEQGGALVYGGEDGVHNSLDVSGECGDGALHSLVGHMVWLHSAWGGRGEAGGGA